MMRRTLIGLAVLTASFLPRPAKADLIVNGGFETGDFTGWTQGGNTGFTFVGSPGNHSNFAAYLGPEGSQGMLSQTFPTTPGETYKISFDFANLGGIPSTPNNFSALFGGNKIFSELDGSFLPFTTFTFTQVAAGTSTTLLFSFRDDPSFLALDNVSVVGLAAASVPEPASLLLWGAVGMAGVWYARRKVQRKLAA